MTMIYISTDLGVQSSGGTVAKYELEAMKKFALETNDNVIELCFNDIHPTVFGLPDIPLFIDLLALDRLNQMDLSSVKLVHMYGASYFQTIRMLKSKGIKTTNTIMFHKRETSISEHERLFGSYPFNYVKDDRLWNLFISGIKEADIGIASGKHPADNMLNEGAKRVEIIPLGCDIPSEDKIVKLSSLAGFRVGYIGACGPDKGLFYLIKAWELLNYQDGSKLIFAGPNTEKILPNFINAFAKAGNFNILGYVNNIADFYNSISIYAQPSTTEAFGMEVVEAMSYGRPVICSDGAGAADCITNGEEGFIVPAMNSEAIVEKIQYFKNNPQEIVRMGNNARVKSLKYTWRNTKDKYIRLWKELSVETKAYSANIEDHTIFTDRNNSLSLLTGRVYESAVTSAAKSVIKQGDTVIDLGANIGYFTLLFAKLVGDRGKVIAFEPDPTNFAILKKNVEINGYKNIVLEQKAVTNKNGVVGLYLAEDNLANHRIFDSNDGRKHVDVECIQLDDYLDKYFKDNNNNNERHIDLIKIDIEGAECAAFEGMTHTLQNNNVKLLAEFYPYAMNKFMKVNGGKPKDFIDILSRYGFKIYDLHNNVPTDKLLEIYNPEVDILTNVFCCKQVIFKNNENKGDNGSIKEVKELSVKEVKKLNIAVCTLCTSEIEDFAKYTTLNMKYYCQIHGYDYIEANDKNVNIRNNISPLHPYIHWHKVLLLYDTLNTNKYDWVFWLDCDALFTNTDIKFEDIINKTKIESNDIDDNIEIIVTKEEAGCCVISTGAMLIRNSEWSKNFLKAWYDKGELPNAQWRDQDTFHYFYYNNEEVRKKVSVVRQKVMNSFTSIFTDGDFIIHFAGRDRSPLRRFAYYKDPNYVSKRDEIPFLLNNLGLTGSGIEIGVQRGLYSAIILYNSCLKKFYLCDPWKQLDPNIYSDVANLNDEEQEKIFNEMVNRVRNYLYSKDRIVILRTTSNQVIESKLFKDEQLDFVYIDANHKYEYILKDIEMWYPKVKNGGIIAGHDYLDGERIEGSFGVKSAVTEFFGNNKNNERIYVTDEDWPSWYVIKNNKNHTI